MSIYSQLPETNDIQLAKTVSEHQSEVAHVQYFFAYIIISIWSMFYCIFTVNVAADQVQGGWQAGSIQLPLLQAAGDSGHASRQGGVSAAESGDLMTSHKGRGNNPAVSLAVSFSTSQFQLFPSASQVKYKQEAGGSLYHQLPETAETQLAKELRGVYSQVRRSLLPMQPTPAPALVCVTAALVLR